MKRTTDIAKAIRTATAALSAGKGDTFKRATGYAERRLGLVGCVAQNGAEQGLRFLRAAVAHIDDANADARRVLYSA